MDKKTDQAQDLLEGQEMLPGFTAQEVPPAQAAHDVNEDQSAQREFVGRSKIGIPADRLDEITLKSILSLAKTFQGLLDQLEERLEALPEPKKNLAPFLLAELPEDSEFLDSCDLAELLALAVDDEGNAIDGPLKEVVERAKRRQTEKKPAYLQRLTPRRYIMPNNALTNDLYGVKGKQPINAGAYDLVVIPEKGRQKEIVSCVTITSELPELKASNDGGRTIGHSLPEYDRVVFNSYTSIIEQAKTDGIKAMFDADAVFRGMPGRGERPSKQQKAKIERTLEKHMRIFLDIDATDEMQTRGYIGSGDTYHLKGYLLQAVEHEYTPKGRNKVKVWEVTGESPAFTYAKATGQLQTASKKLIEIEKVSADRSGKLVPCGKPIFMNENRMAITNYLLRRVLVMKRDLELAKDKWRHYERQRKKDKTLAEKPLAAFRGQSRTILFSTLFKTTGTETTDRKQQMDNRNFCFDVLDYWKATELIASYSQQQKGRVITGIEILLPGDK